MRKETENKKSLLNTKVILIGVILLSLSIRLPALFTRHIDNDEVILRVLAEKVSENFSDYSLQDTAILNQLPRVVYDRPLFHHPPLFIYGLILFKVFLGVKFQILLPVFAAALTVLVIFAIGKELYDDNAGLIAALIFSVCPIVLHASTKIWIDALLTLFCTLSVYLSILAVKKERVLWYILAGVSFGMAVLSKISALPILAPIAYLFLKKPLNKKKLINVSCFLIFAVLVAGPWLFIFYKTFGTFFPWWIKPSEEPLRMFPFIRMAMARPWFFYFSNITIVAPIYLFSWISMIKSIRRPNEWMECIWVLSFILGFTLVGIMGLEGYVTRYVLPAIPALAILSGRLIATGKKILWIVSCIFLAYGLTNAILNTYLFQVADVFSTFYFLNFLK